jgi:HrpA-like RNA helicase
MVDSIFLDEVHERSFNMDIILGCLKQMHEGGKLETYTKVILASATINEKVFQSFLYDCKMFSIKGTTHPITDVFRPPLENQDFVDGVLNTMQEILEERVKGSDKPIYGHILVFLDTIPNIQAMHKKIESLLALNKDLGAAEFMILEIHGMI